MRERERERVGERGREREANAMSAPLSHCYGVLPKGFLTFLGSLYKEVAKLLPDFCVTLRETNRQKNVSSFEKHRVLDLEC